MPATTPSFRCPNCQQRYAWQPALAGRSLPCKKCGQAITVPDAEPRVFEPPAPPSHADAPSSPPRSSSAAPPPAMPPFSFNEPAYRPHIERHQIDPKTFEKLRLINRDGTTMLVLLILSVALCAGMPGPLLAIACALRIGDCRRLIKRDPAFALALEDVPIMIPEVRQFKTSLLMFKICVWLFVGLIVAAGLLVGLMVLLDVAGVLK